MKHNMNTISQKLGGESCHLDDLEDGFDFLHIAWALRSSSWTSLWPELANLFILLETKPRSEDLQYKGFLDIQLDN